LLTAPTTRLLARAALGAAELLTSPARLRPRITLGSAELLASAATEVLAALLGSSTKLLAGLDASLIGRAVIALLRSLVTVLDALAILRIVLELRPAAALSLLDAL
jgi:hypothetical protein